LALQLKQKEKEGNNMKIIITLISLIFFNISFADNFFCTKELETLPIQQGGRIKPLFVHASETLKNLTGKSKVDDLSATEAYCLLSLKAMGMPSSVTLKARIDHVDALKFFNLKNGEHEISYEQLVALEEQVRFEMRSIKDNESYRKAMIKIMNDTATYKEIINGENWFLAEKQNNDIQWLPLTQFLTEKKVTEQKTLTPDDPFAPVFKKSQADYVELKGNKYLVELYYAKANLVSWALLLTLLALTTLVLFKNFNVALTFSILTMITQAVLITFRIIISGRAPITNMYETVLFSGFGSLFLALTLGHFKKEKLFVYMGLGYNLCTLMMLNFANGMLTATISPLVPVLRDNFWLSTHVTTIMLSYGALALSWILANTILIKRKLGKLEKGEEKQVSEVIYTTLKWGTTMLGAGIILGGVWADYSWGRFWGWDPKETWSLIVLCIYIAILHGRYTSWIKAERFITMTAGAFLSVLMAWFGVNYILATGLHSYGFSEGGAIFIGSVFTIQILILVLTNKQQDESSLSA
jgi:cytochrome c-type biogenesis protein CcsB